MSLVGTRPILQDELRQYELHHRARIAIKPGKRPLKYYSLLQLFAKYNFVPVEWYKKYLSFVEKTRLLREDVDEKEEN